jgi:hypothetical protein
VPRDENEATRCAKIAFCYTKGSTGSCAACIGDEAEILNGQPGSVRSAGNIRELLESRHQAVCAQGVDEKETLSGWAGVTLGRLIRVREKKAPPGSLYDELPAITQAAPYQRFEQLPGCCQSCRSRHWWRRRSIDNWKRRAKRTGRAASQAQPAAPRVAQHAAQLAVN